MTRPQIESELAALRDWFAHATRSSNPVGWADREARELYLHGQLARLDGLPVDPRDEADAVGWREVEGELAGRPGQEE